MNLWNQSRRQDERSRRALTRARGPSRKRRFQLESLEERTVLSTFTVAEFFSAGVPVVSETVGNVTTNFVNPASPFVLNTAGAGDTVNILNTSARVPITVNGVANDTVNVGNVGHVQGIVAAVNVQNSHGLTTLNVDDSADGTARAVTLNTFASTDANWGSITGLAPSAINYKYFNTSGVSVTTGTAADTLNVLATGVPTSLSTSDSGDTINVGNAGSVQGILGALSIQNPISVSTLNVNDLAEATARTVTLSTFASGGANWGSITGLAPSEIDYKYSDTFGVNITTGSAADIVNVLGTGVPTSLSTSNGHDTVNVGNAGKIQDILGILSIQNPHSTDAINVSDSVDLTVRTVTLGPSALAGPNWGAITGLAPAEIDYRYSSTSGINILTSGGDTVNVLATGVATTLSSGFGYDVVNVGNAGSVQGILGTLSIINPESFATLSIDDSADIVARTLSLSTLASGGGNWGTITGLAPAAIDYRYSAFDNVIITTGQGNDIANVLATGNNVAAGGLTTSFISAGGLDTVNVGNAGSVQGILGPLHIENPPNMTTVNVNDSADATARTMTQSTITFTPGGLLWGSITGLAPAAIDYRYVDTSSVNVTTGSGNDVVNILSTGPKFNLSSSSGQDTINVGNASSVGSIGAVNIQNIHGSDTIIVNDSADTVARTVTLSTFVSGGANWGSITGLAPGAIDYRYAGRGAVNITTGSGNDTVNVHGTGTVTTLSSSGGNDTVNVGNAGSVQGILGDLTIQNPGDVASIHVDDSADTVARTVTLNLTVSSGITWDTITGLAPRVIRYNNQFDASASVTTGSGNDTVNVLTTDTPIDLNTSGGNDTVNVGNAGHTQGINQNLTILNPHGHDTINVNDSADTNNGLVAIETNGSGLGAIVGISPSFIEFSLAGTSSVNVTTGSGNDSVEVDETGVPINLSSSGGQDSIVVGFFNDNVQDILAPLTIQNAHGRDTIIVNDSADTTARTATLSTFASGGVNWGSITGLAPAAIDYRYNETASVAIETGLGNDTLNVHGTGVLTTLISFGGHDTVNVGNAGSVQGILGTLDILNSSGLTTLNIDDSADTMVRTARLSTIASGGALNTGSITGLAPAAIDFRYGSTSSPVNITTSAGLVSWIVATDARASVTGVVVKDNGLQIN
jgi:hypothetical protein